MTQCPYTHAQSLMLRSLQRPSTVGLAPVFSETAAFISGVNWAFSGEPLKGLEEWLIVRKRYPEAQLWQMIVLASVDATFVFGKSGWGLSLEDDVAAMKVLTEVLAEFFDEMNSSRHSLRSVYIDYQKWLWGQDWYAPDLPGYIPPPDVGS